MSLCENKNKVDDGFTLAGSVKRMAGFACVLVASSCLLAYGASEGLAIDPDAIAYLEVMEEPLVRGLVHLPGVLITGKDNILIIAQSRLEKGDWDPSDIVVVRSSDNGRSWGKTETLYKSNENQTGYSCMLVEDRTSTPNAVFAFYTVAPSPWTPEALVWMGRRSQDEGESWSEPFRVNHDENPQSKPSNGGHGFQFENGRMVIPGRGNFLYSDDGGVSWITNGEAKTVETKVVPAFSISSRKLDSVYMISRRTLEYRIYSDNGEVFAESGDHGNEFTTLGRNPGLERYETPNEDDTDIYLMSGILDNEDRALGVTYSLDQGRTWSKRAIIDEAGWYSDIGVTSEGMIVVTYTVGFSEDLKVARFNLRWLMENVGKQ